MSLDVLSSRKLGLQVGLSYCKFLLSSCERLLENGSRLAVTHFFLGGLPVMARSNRRGAHCHPDRQSSRRHIDARTTKRVVSPYTR